MKLRQSSNEIIVKGRELNGLSLSRSVYPPDLRQPRHAHRLASFSFVMAGRFLENYHQKSVLRESSSVIFHPPDKSHAVHFEAGVRIVNVQFDDRRLASVREHSNVLDEGHELRSENIERLGRRLYREFENPDAFSALAIEGLILEILAEASRCQTKAGEHDFPRWLAETRDFLHDNFAASFLIEDIARIAGVHPVHLARVFRRKFGCTIGEYVRRLRVEFADRQLAATETPLSEIALAAGFADQSHLNKTFKSVFGLTPAAYRKISRRS